MPAGLKGGTFWRAFALWFRLNLNKSTIYVKATCLTQVSHLREGKNPTYLKKHASVIDPVSRIKNFQILEFESSTIILTK